MARVIPGVSLLVPWYYVFSNLKMVGGFEVLILSHMFVVAAADRLHHDGLLRLPAAELEESA